MLIKQTDGKKCAGLETEMRPRLINISLNLGKGAAVWITFDPKTKGLQSTTGYPRDTHLCP
jgi:hypothetical protein